MLTPKEYCVRFRRMGGVIGCGLFGFFLLAGCSDSGRIWSSGDYRSQDGVWIARAYTRQYGGLGTDATQTWVELVRPGSQDFKILNFEGSGPERQLTIKWLNPEHLDVTYHGGSGILYFQVVKAAGIQITARDVGG